MRKADKFHWVFTCTWRPSQENENLKQWLVAQSLSPVQHFVTPWTAAHQASLSFTISQSLLKLMSIESVMPSSHLILLSPSPPAFNLSQHHGLFKWVSSSHQVAKGLVFQLQHQSFQWILRTLGWTGWISLPGESMSVVDVMAEARDWHNAWKPKKAGKWILPQCF